MKVYRNFLLNTSGPTENVKEAGINALAASGDVLRWLFFKRCGVIMTPGAMTEEVKKTLKKVFYTELWVTSDKMELLTKNWPAGQKQKAYLELKATWAWIKEMRARSEKTQGQFALRLTPQSFLLPGEKE